jgi:hypothetical protein
MKNAVARAIAAVGGPTQASFITRFSVAQLYNWRAQGFVRDGKAAVRLARASGIPVAELVGLDGTDEPGDPSGACVTAASGPPRSEATVPRSSAPAAA